MGNHVDSAASDAPTTCGRTTTPAACVVSDHEFEQANKALDVAVEPESWWSHLPKIEIGGCIIFVAFGLVLWFGPLAFASRAGVGGLIAGAFSGVIVSEIVTCNDSVKNAKRHNQLVAHASLLENQISSLQHIAGEESLPAIRAACELGSRLVDEMPSQWRTPEERRNILRVAGRLGIEKDLAELLKDPPDPAELSGAIYDTLTDIVRSEVLASYRIGYYLSWASSFFVAYDEIRDNKELLWRFATDIRTEFGRLVVNKNLGIGQDVISYIEQCLAIWSDGVGDSGSWYQFFEHLIVFLRTLGLPDPPTPAVAAFVARLAREKITPVNDAFKGLSENLISIIKEQGSSAD